MTKRKIEVDLSIKGTESVAQAEKKFMSLKDELKLLKGLMRDGVFEGDEFEQVAKRAGQLQDKLNDVNQRVKNLASDSQKLDGFINITQGIVGGFAAVQGITALVGEENEDLQKTMVKLQATMTALNGVQAIANLLQEESSALLAINTIKTNIQAGAQTLLTFATGGTTVAMNAFRIALLATGIGAIIILLYEGAKAMNLFGDSAAETTEQLKKAAEAKELLNNKFKEGDNELIARYAQERDIAKARLKLAGATNAQLIEEDRKFLIKKKALLELEVTDTDLNGDARHKAQLEVNAINNELELKQLELQQAKKDELLKRQSKKEVERKKEVAKEQEKKVNDDLQKNPNFGLYETELEAWEKRKAFEKQQQDEEVKAWQDMYDAKVSIAQSSFNILNDIAYLALGDQYKLTALGKTLAIAQIATDTALAISALVKNSESNPLNGPTGGIAGAAQFIAGIARITANIANAKRVLTGGSTSISGGSGGASGGSLNSQPPSIRGYIPQETTGDRKDTKVYVLEKDITDSQGRIVRIRRNAELI